MPLADQLHSMQVYNQLLANPVLTLQNHDMEVNQLPVLPNTGVQNLWFAAFGPSIVIDQTSLMAGAMAAGLMGPQDCAVQRSMVVSPMRGHGLPPANRYAATGLVNAAAIAANLWVTELQTGCTVLIVDWGAGQYSMTHLQPSDDVQFNRFGRALMWTSNFAHNAYKNTWLKQEMTTVIQNTGGAPQRYIMVQSMFENTRRRVTQVVGVRNGGQFTFYRQRVAAARVVEQLQWSTWYAYVPYFSY